MDKARTTVRRLDMKDIKLGKAFEVAAELEAAEHDALEQEKRDRYRAGMTGLFRKGKLYGKCARTLFLRSKGLKDSVISRDKINMFAGGLMNEEIVVKDLKLGASEYNILREEEIPTKWETDTRNTLVTGRPDIVLQDPDTKELVLGLELKMVSSVWTARSVAQGKPKMYHLLQAAHYMWQLGVPFKLVYKSYVNFATPLQGYKYFPKEGEPGSEFMEYSTTYRYQNGEKHEVPYCKTVLPFTKIYDMKFSDEGLLLIKDENAPFYEETVITKEGIKEYFEELDRVLERKQLPARPKNIDYTGKREGWTDCSYCALESICDSSETDLTKWLDEVTLLNESFTNKKG